MRPDELHAYVPTSGIPASVRGLTLCSENGHYGRSPHRHQIPVPDYLPQPQAKLLLLVGICEALHLRYEDVNPVRARLRRHPETHPWSSARAHLAGRDDALVTVAPLLSLVPDWAGFLAAGLEAEALDTLRGHERTGRPLGDTAFIERLERQLDRPLAKRRPGPKVKTPEN